MLLAEPESESQAVSPVPEEASTAGIDQDQIDTIRLITCVNCKASLCQSHKFCRWCGVRQVQEPAVERRDSDSLASFHSEFTFRDKRPKAGRYHTLSDQLVTAMVESLSASLTSQVRSRTAKVIIQVLISMPIWLIIILLSPLDAYSAVKNLSKSYQG
jgi:hypothetical protein